MTDLVAIISTALRDRDPLDPWDTESAWDDDYWIEESEAIAGRLRHGMRAAEVRAVVVDVLGNLLGSSADGEAGCGSNHDDWI